MKHFGLVAAALLSIVLGACGGGGSGDIGGGEPPPGGTVYPLQAAFVSSRSDTSSYPFSGSGTINGVPFSVSGSVAAQPMRTATFEGRPAQARDTAMAGILVVNGASQPMVSMSTEFLGTDFMPLGMADGEYDVVVGVANIPPGVQVGGSGTMYGFTRYADASKAVQLGTGSAKYAVVSDSAGSATVQVITTETEQDGSLTTMVQTFALSWQGKLTPLGEELTSASQHLVITYGAPL